VIHELQGNLEVRGRDVIIRSRTRCNNPVVAYVLLLIVDPTFAPNLSNLKQDRPSLAIDALYVLIVAHE
jgi:hypothetical protein